jgi:hypothetical protein
MPVFAVSATKKLGMPVRVKKEKLRAPLKTPYLNLLHFPKNSNIDRALSLCPV